MEGDTTETTEAGGSGEMLDMSDGLGASFEITKTAEQTGGELLEIINVLYPGMVGPPIHVHPTIEESYEVLEGEIEVYSGGGWSTVRQGESASVPPGEPHSVRNLGDEPARIRNLHAPALRFESFVRDMHHLIESGKIKSLPPSEPRSAIYAAMLFGAYPDEIRVVRPPNFVFTALAGIGKLLRMRIRD